MTRLLALLSLLAAIGLAQPKPAFEVVSIKLAPRPTPEGVRDGTTRIGFKIEGGRMESVGYGLIPLIARAFNIETERVDPHGFTGTEFFEVQAKLPDGATPAQVPEMLQAMLAERFKLAYHRETRDYPSTVVTLGKNGMKLQRMPDGTRESTSTSPISGGGTRTTTIGTLKSLFPVMNSFGRFPQMVDETGLDGMYTWVFDTHPSATLNFFDATHEAFEAMFDAAGLKLESRKVAKETIVIDHGERLPTEN